jgi:hypothetical protein
MANNSPSIYVSSYTNGGIMKTMNANKVADILTELNVPISDAEFELEDAQGNEKVPSPSTTLNEGDVLLIMKKKNKSGN